MLYFLFLITVITSTIQVGAIGVWVITYLDPDLEFYVWDLDTIKYKSHTRAGIAFKIVFWFYPFILSCLYKKVKLFRVVVDWLFEEIG